MDPSGSTMKPSGAATIESLAKLEMHRQQQIRFICPNFATEYIPGVLKLPSVFCAEYGDTIPERVLLHVPPRVVWKGLYRKDTLCIERLEKMMSSYCIKPYHLILFQYHGGNTFYLKIFNPYGVEISYHIENRIHPGVELDKKLLKTSTTENDKLCGTLAFNAYESGKGLCDVVLRRRHLSQGRAYDVLDKRSWESLGIVESMEWIKLSYRKHSWLVKLHWEDGNLYLGRRWYSFAMAGNLQRGDTIAFKKSEKAQKYIICVFEKDLLGKCNVAGVGHPNGTMDWLKIANLEFLSTGEMEIPRVFRMIPGMRIPESVRLLFPDGERLMVKYSSDRNMLSGMKKIIKQYSIRATDVMIFSLTGEGTFLVSLFNISGMESKYIVFRSDALQTVSNIPGEDTVNRFEDNNEVLEEGHDDHAQMEAVVQPNDIHNFRVTLKPSHVDKRQHGVYLPTTMYPYYKRWSSSTVITLLCGESTSQVSVLRYGRACRFGKGWSEFTKNNNLSEGQSLELSYVDNFTFQVIIVH